MRRPVVFIKMGFIHISSHTHAHMSTRRVRAAQPRYTFILYPYYPSLNGFTRSNRIYSQKMNKYNFAYGKITANPCHNHNSYHRELCNTQYPFSGGAWKQKPMASRVYAKHHRLDFPFAGDGEWLLSSSCARVCMCVSRGSCLMRASPRSHTCDKIYVRCVGERGA